MLEELPEGRMANHQAFFSPLFGRGRLTLSFCEIELLLFSVLRSGRCASLFQDAGKKEHDVCRPNRRGFLHLRSGADHSSIGRYVSEFPLQYVSVLSRAERLCFPQEVWYRRVLWSLILSPIYRRVDISKGFHDLFFLETYTWEERAEKVQDEIGRDHTT